MDMLHLLLESCGFNIEHRTTVKNYMMSFTSKPGFFILLHHRFTASEHQPGGPIRLHRNPQLLASHLTDASERHQAKRITQERAPLTSPATRIKGTGDPTPPIPIPQTTYGMSQSLRSTHRQSLFHVVDQGHSRRESAETIYPQGTFTETETGVLISEEFNSTHWAIKRNRHR